jgi:hypothetical protein
VKIHYVTEPFKLSEIPLKDVYVFDDFLSSEMHRAIDSHIYRSSIWSKTNQVRGDSPTGLAHHSFWGATYFRGVEGGSKKVVDNDMNPRDTYLAQWFNRKIQTDFGFQWVRFQYMGLNSQTQGLQGTTHADCSPEDEWNLSFLYYTNKFWNKEWGGSLRFYDEMQQGIDGRDEHIKNHQIGEVEFKPNRLLMFDGRIPHGADAPSPKARYMDRKSIVLRGDEIRLIKDTSEWFHANDRIYNI